MKFTCKNCSEYDTCTKLCPEAEGYVSQDEVKKTGRTFSEVGIDSDKIINSFTDSITQDYLTLIQRRIKTLSDCGLSSYKIAKIVKRDPAHVRRVIRNLNKG